MIRCPVVLERMSFDQKTGEIFYRARPSRARGPFGGTQRFDILEFIARVTDHIPEMGQQLVRYWGTYANASLHRRRRALPTTGHPHAVPVVAPAVGLDAARDLAVPRLLHDSLLSPLRPMVLY